MYFKYIYKPCIPEIPTLLLQGKRVERKNHMGQGSKKEEKILD